MKKRPFGCESRGVVLQIFPKQKIVASNTLKSFSGNNNQWMGSTLGYFPGLEQADVIASTGIMAMNVKHNIPAALAWILISL